MPLEVWIGFLKNMSHQAQVVTAASVAIQLLGWAILVWKWRETPNAWRVAASAMALSYLPWFWPNPSIDHALQLMIVLMPAQVILYPLLHLVMVSGIWFTSRGNR